MAKRGRGYSQGLMHRRHRDRHPQVDEISSSLGRLYIAAFLACPSNADQDPASLPTTEKAYRHIYLGDGCKSCQEFLEERKTGNIAGKKEDA
jgi:hypothetical protein